MATIDEAVTSVTIDSISVQSDTAFESRRDRERRQRREAMLVAAVAVFAERGYADASLDEIAQRAEFGKGTLYNYFPGGKQTLLMAVFDDIFSAVTELFEMHLSPERLQETPIEDAFEALFGAMSVFFDERRQAFRVLMKEGHKMVLGGDAEPMRPLHRHRTRVNNLTARALDIGIAQGRIRPVPTALIAPILMELLKMTHMHQLVAEECAWETPMPAHDPAATAHLLRTLLFDGLTIR